MAQHHRHARAPAQAAAAPPAKSTSNVLTDRVVEIDVAGHGGEIAERERPIGAERQRDGLHQRHQEQHAEEYRRRRDQQIGRGRAPAHGGSLLHLAGAGRRRVGRPARRAGSVMIFCRIGASRASAACGFSPRSTISWNVSSITLSNSPPCVPRPTGSSAGSASFAVLGRAIAVAASFTPGSRSAGSVGLHHRKEPSRARRGNLRRRAASDSSINAAAPCGSGASLAIARPASTGM